LAAHRYFRIDNASPDLVKYHHCAIQQKLEENNRQSLRGRVYELLKRFEAEGEGAFAPRSRKPHSNSRGIPIQIEERITFWRRSLVSQGHDAGAATIAANTTEAPTTANFLYITFL
jgi:hypothetical protein